jgi:hypothetical protein
MRLYYRGRDAVVTEESFYWLVEPYKVFPIRGLSEACRTRADPASPVWNLRARRNRPWEIRAVYRGHQHVLYASRDEQTFQQVARALSRAIRAAAPRE